MPALSSSAQLGEKEDAEKRGRRESRAHILALIDDVEGPDAHEAKHAAFRSTPGGDYIDFDNGWHAVLHELRRRISEEK